MSFLYHVTNQKLRKQIAHEGLRGHQVSPIWKHIKPQPQANYGFQYLEDALDYRFAVIDKFSDKLDQDDVENHCDVWRFDTTGLKLVFDPEVMLMRGEIEPQDKCLTEACKSHPKTSSRWYVKEWISPQRLILIKQEEYEEILLEELPKYFRYCSYRARMNPLPIWK